MDVCGGDDDVVVPETVVVGAVIHAAVLQHRVLCESSEIEETRIS